MRIAVDVMGGDHGPRVVVAGAKLALEASPAITELFLVGPEAEIRAALPSPLAHERRLKIVHASEVLTMQDKPLDAVASEPPGFNRPSASARRTMARAMRSFTLPLGFRFSSLARTSAEPEGVTAPSRTRGVRPIRSRTVGAIGVTGAFCHGDWGASRRFQYLLAPFSLTYRICGNMI